MRGIKAFTLVELAISMIIIGLLIGGTIKGLEFIENSRVTSTLAQIKSYDTAITAFRDIYGAWPGDIVNPAGKIPSCTNDPCTRSGNGDNVIGFLVGSSATGGVLTVDNQPELYTFWLHLGSANLIAGNNPTTTNTTLTQYGDIIPAAKMGGGFNIGSFNWSSGSNYQDPFAGTALLLGDRPPSYWGTLPTTGPYGHNALRLYTLDMKLDDGKPTTGNIRNYTSAGCYTADRLNYPSNDDAGASLDNCAPLIIKIQN